MIQYLTVVFKAMYLAEPGTAEDLGCSPKELAEVTTSDAFEEAELDHDGNLSFKEFQKWQEQTGEEGRSAADISTAWPVLLLQPLLQSSGA